MQVPMGVSGVQAVPNTLHSHGLMATVSTSLHWQAFGSATRTPGTSKRSSASHLATSDLSFRAHAHRPGDRGYREMLPLIY